MSHGTLAAGGHPSRRLCLIPKKTTDIKLAVEVYSESSRMIVGIE